jgi:uncharacterized membrane protein YkgB
LGVVFIWFGALKFSSASPVGELVAHTVPFLPAKLFVPALGGFEVLLGLGLLLGRQLEIVAGLMVLHLTGTFLVLVTQPSIAFQHGNPFMLTMTGEFVVKNVVLITAGIVLATLRITPAEGFSAAAFTAGARDGAGFNAPALSTDGLNVASALPAATAEVPAEAS